MEKYFSIIFINFLLFIPKSFIFIFSLKGNMKSFLFLLLNNLDQKWIEEKIPHLKNIKDDSFFTFLFSRENFLSEEENTIIEEINWVSIELSHILSNDDLFSIKYLFNIDVSFNFKEILEESLSLGKIKIAKYFLLKGTEEDEDDPLTLWLNAIDKEYEDLAIFLYSYFSELHNSSTQKDILIVSAEGGFLKMIKKIIKNLHFLENTERNELISLTLEEAKRNNQIEIVNYLQNL